ncbi:SMP-30/gluconolactonase/LRE family protein [Poriferisphaera corsica]|nr:SMP-30/gluconolactonase/LRE family protein [Poriferisphaera corsica]
MQAERYDIIADVRCVLGEGPVWHPHEQALYWTDIELGRLWRWVEGCEAEVVYEGRKVGGFTVQADGSLLLFRDNGNVVVWQDGHESGTVIDQIPGHANERFNDVCADPMGRVYAGTVCGSGLMGRLIRLDVGGDWHEVLGGVACSNGMDLTLDQKMMYYTDSEMRTIWSYQYDQSHGGLHGRGVFVEVPEGEGVPDGLTVDKSGDVWSARWDGWGVYRYGPDGQMKEKVELPAAQVSSVCFGGQGYKDMFVTSAGGHLDDWAGVNAGAVFRVNTDAVGCEPNMSRICL